jgi:NADH-quinone oxidoreductase subunit M
VIAAVGVLLAAAYMLWMVLRVVLGKPSEVLLDQPDASARELWLLAPLVALTLVVGLSWSSLLGFVDPAVKALVALMGGAA